MADGKYIGKKFYDLVSNDATIKANVVQIAQGDYLPIGSGFPQIVFCFYDLDSEEVLPAKRMFLQIYVWVDPTATPSPKAKLEVIKAAIDALINRNIGSPFNEINTETNKGLRVVMCLKSSAKDSFDNGPKKYVYDIGYKLVVSEGEDFSSDGGGAVWSAT